MHCKPPLCQGGLFWAGVSCCVCLVGRIVVGRNRYGSVGVVSTHFSLIQAAGCWVLQPRHCFETLFFCVCKAGTCCLSPVLSNAHEVAVLREESSKGCAWLLCVHAGGFGYRVQGYHCNSSGVVRGRCMRQGSLWVHCQQDVADCSRPSVCDTLSRFCCGHFLLLVVHATGVLYFVLLHTAGFWASH